MRILIIEDNTADAEWMKRLLEESLQVEVAYRAEEAIKIAAEFQPDLIISDWNLHDTLDGIEVCTTIIEKRAASVIFVSGSPIEDLKIAAKALAPLKIFSKPVDLDELALLIADIAKTHMNAPSSS